MPRSRFVVARRYSEPRFGFFNAIPSSWRPFSPSIFVANLTSRVYTFHEIKKRLHSCICLKRAERHSARCLVDATLKRVLGDPTAIPV